MSTPPSGQLLVPADLQKGLSWGQKHEKIIIVFLVLFFGSLGLHHYLFNASAKAEARATLAENTLAAQKTLDTQQAQQTAQVTQQYQAMLALLTQQNQTLSQAIASRSAALPAQRQADSQLPLSDLTVKLQTLGNTPTGSVTNTATAVTLTQPATLAVVEQLETIPVLQGNFNDESKIADNEKVELATANTVIYTQSNQINGLQVTLKEADVACKAEVTAAKKRGRLQSFKWFIKGFFVGAVSGLYAGHAI